MLVLVLSDHPDDEARRERLRALAGLDCDLILGTPGGQVDTLGSIRLAPIKVSGDPAEPADLDWHRPTLRKLITETRPDLIHVEAEPDSPLAASVAAIGKKLGVPFVLFGWRAGLRTSGFFGRRKAATVLESAAGVLGANAIARDFLHEHAPGALAAAIPASGVTLPPAVERPGHESLVVGFAGRLVPERGTDLLIESLGATYGKWRAILAGTGPEQEALEQLVQRLGLASRIRWLGGIRPEALAELWPEIDCLVIPTRDGPGAAEQPAGLLLEAMGRGIAPIVTNVGAFPELVGPAGVVVENQVGLTEALQRWVIDPGASRAAGAAARQWVIDRYLTSVVAARTLDFWRAVLEHVRATSETSAS